MSIVNPTTIKFKLTLIAYLKRVTSEMWLNIGKCHLLRFAAQRNPFHFTYKIGILLVNAEPHIMYLGRYFSENLVRHRQFTYTVSRANRMLGFIKCNFEDCPASVKKVLHIKHLVNRLSANMRMDIKKRICFGSHTYPQFLFADVYCSL